MLQVLGGCDSGRRRSVRADPDQAEQPVADRVQGDDQRKDGALDAADRANRESCGRSPWDHFADDDMQVGEDRDGNRAGYGVRTDPAQGVERREPAADLLGEPVLAVHAKPEAGDGDPDLCRRDIAAFELRILENPKGASSQPAPL